MIKKRLKHFLLLSLPFLVLILSPISICSNELVVHLATDEEPVQSVYLARLRPCETGFEKSVYDTLVYDFTHNGKTRLLPINEQLQYAANLPDETEAFQAKKWRDAGARFVIVPTIENDQLHIKLFDVNKSSLKTLLPLKLSKSLKLDVRGIHKISDTLHQLMFGEDGIASKRILFSYQQKVEANTEGMWHSEIWEMASDGQAQRQITKENHYSISPTFLRDPSNHEKYQFAYVTYKQGQPRIYFTSRDEPRGKPLIPLRGNQLLPAISPKRDQVAFISDASGRADLFVQGFHPDKGSLGKPQQVYSFPSSVQASPSFSPDGNKIAFVSDKSGTPRIYIIDLIEVINHRQTPNLKLISKLNRDNSGPSWSQDGKKIAYSARTNGVRQIWIYDTEKDEEWQLTTGMGNKENPKWASNNLHLVYNTTSPTYDIFILNLNQCEAIRLTQGPGIKHYPAFEP